MEVYKLTYANLAIIKGEVRHTSSSTVVLENGETILRDCSKWIYHHTFDQAKTHARNIAEKKLRDARREAVHWSLKLHEIENLTNPDEKE